jgi:hypothetical protein
MCRALTGLHFSMNKIDFVNKILEAIDTDDLQNIAFQAEAALNSEDIGNLKNVLNIKLLENVKNFEKHNNIRHFLFFLC